MYPCVQRNLCLVPQWCFSHNCTPERSPYRNTPHQFSKILSSCRLSGAFLAALVALLAAGCSHIETLDANGKHTESWSLASNHDFSAGSATKIMRVTGFGMHQIGSVWSLGLHSTEIVATSAECQLIVLDGMKNMTGKSGLPLKFNEICSQYGTSHEWASEVSFE